MRVQNSAIQADKGRGCSSPCGVSCLGCGVVLAAGMALIIAGFVLLIPRLPALFLQATGFEVAGATTDFIASAPASPALPERINPQPLGAGTNAALGNQSFNLAEAGVTIREVSVPSADARVLEVNATEASLNDLMRQLVQNIDPSGQDIQLSGASVDVFNGGAVIRATISLPQVNIGQQIGVVLQFTPENQLRLAGLDVNGTLLSPAGVGDIQDAVRSLEQDVNQSLREGIVINGQNYAIWRIFSDANQLTVLLR